ncbi:hypothetical protein TorRG33x02_326470 [Trema orientale]|uniref:Uncharacterized protein n=1 Tax=Trema orientale TaxID=63057 RepID=A0A2P5BBX4_TREOI|nr:hypothetical protein TorRG33x02_326470 [Trema orientale]
MTHLDSMNNGITPKSIFDILQRANVKTWVSLFLFVLLLQRSPGRPFKINFSMFSRTNHDKNKISLSTSQTGSHTINKTTSSNVDFPKVKHGKARN